MDIKELKFLEIQSTDSKAGSDPRATTEPATMPSARSGQSNRSTHPHVTSSSTHLSTVPVTTLRRGR